MNEARRQWLKDFEKFISKMEIETLKEKSKLSGWTPEEIEIIKKELLKRQR